MILLSLAMSVLAQAADTPPAAKPAATEAAVPVPEKKICRSLILTGTILPRRTCRTRAEWVKLENETGNAWETARGKRGFVTRSPGDQM